MLGLRRALLALFALGVIFAGLDVALALTSSHEDQKLVTALLGPLIGLSFIGTGVFAWWRRPLNRFGLLMTGVGIAWFLSGLTESNNSTVFTIGSYVEPLYLVLVIQMVLSFPTGRLETFAQRVTIAAGYLDVLAVRLPFFLLGGDISGDLKGPRPDNVFAIVDAPDLADVFDYTSTFVAVVVLISTFVLLLQKRRAATPPQRRALAPMLWTGTALVGLLGVAFVIDVLGLPGKIGDIAGLLALIAFAVLPFAFLAGLVRSRYSRAGAVGELIERLNNPEADRSLGHALADALGDRSLKLVYWRPSAGHYVTFDGRPVALPEAGSGRAVTEVEREGIRVGAIIHDASLADEPGLVRAVGRVGRPGARERAPGGRAARPPGRAADLALAAGRGLDVRAPAPGARSARRRPAAPRRALAAARAGQAPPGGGRGGRRRRHARRRARRAGPRSGGAARAGARHPSRRPHRPRPGAGARGARRASPATG